MTTAEIIGTLQSRGMRPGYLIPLDENYSHPKRSWVNGTFAAAFRRNLKALGLDKYVAEANDCDKFSGLAWALVRAINGRSSATRGIAFGWMIYITRNLTPHDINVYVTAAGAVRFWEPQSQEETTLTEEEINSCTVIVI